MIIFYKQEFSVPQKFQIIQCVIIEFNYCRVDFTAILPELYMEVADPELPAHKGMLSSLFGSSHHSVVDREELCKLIVNSY